MADTLTDNFSLVKIEPATAGWDIKTNLNLDVLDSILLKLLTLAQLMVKDKDLTAPPGSPVDHDVYIIATSATGAWSGFDNHVAIWSANAAGWAILTPANGWQARVTDEGSTYQFNGSSWVRTASEFRGCKVLRVGNQSIPNNSLTTIDLAANPIDVNVYFDTDSILESDGGFIVPVGVTKIRLTGQVAFAASAVGIRSLVYSYNETTNIVGKNYKDAMSSGLTIVQCDSGILKVTAGNKFYPRVLQISGGALNIEANAGGFTSDTWFQLEVIN